MLTVKFLKYNSISSSDQPTHTDGIMVRECASVHVDLRNTRTKVQLNDAPGETFETVVGPGADCPYNKAYVMNREGQTVETIT